MGYAELHCHSYYSFHYGASSLEELLLRSRELGYWALAITDHNNLCGAMRFAQLTHSLDLKGIISLPLTVSQDMLDLVKPTDWENVKEEYQVLTEILTLRRIVFRLVEAYNLPNQRGFFQNDRQKNRELNDRANLGRQI